MADDANGVIYRVAYKETTMSATQKPPATAMENQAKQGSGVPLGLVKSSRIVGESRSFARRFYSLSDSETQR